MPPSHSGSANNQVKSVFLRWTLICCGWFCIGSGVVGLFLPVVPTVPFLLLAAACFARSSEKFHGWLVHHNHLGPLLHNYLNGAGIPFKAKRIAISMIWVSFPASTFLFARVLWLKVLLITAAVCITIYLFSLPTSTGEEMVQEDNDK